MKKSEEAKKDKNKDQKKKVSDPSLDKRNIDASAEKLLSKDEIRRLVNIVEVHCSCGFRFLTQMCGRQSRKLDVIVCGKCHPFFSGKKRVIDETQRISKFNKKYRKEESK